MNSTASLQSFFSSSPVVDVGRQIYSLQGSSPVPFCLTMTNLIELEKSLAVDHSRHYLSSLLSADENELFSTYTYPKRRREWLGGRLAAKTAVLNLLHAESIPDTMPALSILPADNGSPRLSSSVFDADHLPALSISHSDRFAVAIAAHAETCGIDIQKISDKTVRVADRFTEPGEVELLRDHAPQLNLNEHLTLLWSAKEALKKAVLHDQPVIFQGIALQSMNMDQYFSLLLHFPGDRNVPAEVTAVMLEDCILAYTFAQKRHA